jgi:acetoin utilization protein AcuC
VSILEEYMQNPRVSLVYSESMSSYSLRDGHVQQPVRVRYAYELMDAYDMFREGAAQLVAPRMASESEINVYHTSEYIEAVKRFSDNPSSLNSEAFGFHPSGDTPAFKTMFPICCEITGASILGAELILNGTAERVFSPGGGWHHAMSNRASGFCVFNDPVIAIHKFLEAGLRVAYIDIDAHHGDGVQDAFYDTDKVITISIHENGEYLFPGTGFTNEIGTGQGERYSMNIPLAPYSGDAVYMWVFQEIVPPVIRNFEPDVIVTQLGLDGHAYDPITHLNLSVQGFGDIVKQFREMRYPWLALGGGGYDVWAVARGWTLAFGLMNNLELSDVVPQKYASKYDLMFLRDDIATFPKITKDLTNLTWNAALSSVQHIKETWSTIFSG